MSCAHLSLKIKRHTHRCGSTECTPLIVRSSVAPFGIAGDATRSKILFVLDQYPSGLEGPLSAAVSVTVMLQMVSN